MSYIKEHKKPIFTDKQLATAYGQLKKSSSDQAEKIQKVIETICFGLESGAYAGNYSGFNLLWSALGRGTNKTLIKQYVQHATPLRFRDNKFYLPEDSKKIADDKRWSGCYKFVTTVDLLDFTKPGGPKPEQEFNPAKCFKSLLSSAKKQLGNLKEHPQFQEQQKDLESIISRLQSEILIAEKAYVNFKDDEARKIRAAKEAESITNAKDDAEKEEASKVIEEGVKRKPRQLVKKDATKEEIAPIQAEKANRQAVVAH